MSKAKTVNGIEFPENCIIIDNFVERYNHSYEMVQSYRSILERFEIWYGKSFGLIEIRNIKSYQTYLNNHSDYTLATKKLYFGKVKVFIESLILDYAEYFNPQKLILFIMFLKDSKNLQWKGKHFHKESNRDNEEVLEKSEIVEILSYLKKKDFNKYLMVRVITETGMRKGELRSIDLSVISKGKIILIEEDLENRQLRVKGKTGKKIYFISQTLARVLLKYAEGRRKRKAKNESNAFFLSWHGNRTCRNTLNVLFNGYNRKNGRTEGITEILSLNKKICPKTFRLSINDHRERMDCPEKYLKILLNHKESGVNYTHYVSNKTKKSKFLEYYDKFNPYKNLKL